LESGYLQHVFNVFERLGYVNGSPFSDWEVLWSHDYPFVSLSKHVSDLKPYQKVNHFPGSGYITNKASLASTNMPFIPKAFKMPEEKKKFLEYVNNHQDTMWVKKGNHHRGIEIKSVQELDLTQKGTFIQEYVAKPYLIDGKKFDIGIYTILTSINPLRLYIVNGEVLVRFCAKKYHPFDPKTKEQYVVGDNYTPMWQVPSLKEIFTEMEFSFKNTLHYQISNKTSENRANQMWSDIEEAILTVYKDKESKLIESAAKYKTTRNFFEMVRFDFVLDEDLNVYLMEANMSPNLSSNHFKENKRLYEHVIYNMLGLVGIGRSVTSHYHRSADDVQEMLVSRKDISVFPEFCIKHCLQSCLQLECKICSHCLTTSLESTLKTAYLEHMNKGSCKRLFPPIMVGDKVFQSLKKTNKLMQIWFIGKCRHNPSFCI
ncbi:hypothetical protein LOTGIDRAFT_110692, partial [Lottia gigantea]